MALFGSKKKTESKAEAKAPVKKNVPATQSGEATGAERNLTSIIQRPHITEKASTISESNVYAFEVSDAANKKTIAYAVKELYNVTPIKVAIVRIPGKKKFIRGKWGVKGGGKKAYVYLKKGETIEFV
jgi:large subunit ribosomal protein L23